MRKLFIGLLAIAAVQVALAAPAADKAAGGALPPARILATEVWPALPDWEDLDEFTHDYLARSAYEETRTQTRFRFEDITYASDGIPVHAMLIRPVDPGKHKWPVIVFNRGGNGDYSRIGNYGAPCKVDADSCLYRADLYMLAKEGFVIIATDYRFHGPTAKRDEWGGVEVNDVLNLFPVLDSLDYVDPSRAYLFGLSRGGMMTYLALKHGAPVKAAAVIAGPSHLSRNTTSFIHGDWFVRGNEWFDGAASVWPDYEHRADEHYRARSAVFWADQIHVPVLILHSRTDPLVPVGQALEMATALQEKGKVYELHIYESDGHALPRNWVDRNQRIVDWFRRFGAANAGRSD